MVEKGPIFLVFVLQANALYCNSTFSERKEYVLHRYPCARIRLYYCC